MSPTDGPRVIIHAGFHKTGTKTVQHALHANRAQLAPHVRILLKSAIAGVCDAALIYARRPSKNALSDFASAVHAHLATWARSDHRPVIISAEDLCGLIPGRHGRVGYPHAVALLRTLLAELRTCARPQLYFSTRASAPWMQSCYAHHVRHTRLRLDQTTYAADQHIGSDLNAQVADIAAHFGPVAVRAVALEDSISMPQGPLTPLLDLAGIPGDLRDQMQPVVVANMALPPDILSGLLALNRSDINGPALAKAKRALIANHKKAN